MDARTVDSLSLNINSSSVALTRIVFGNSSSSLSDKNTFLGDLRALALVVKENGLTDDLQLT